MNSNIAGNTSEAREKSRVLGVLLVDLGARIASCESCTSGALADAISWAPGASAWFEVGLVCYSERAKTLLAGVDPLLFATDGVVSRKVAEAMARGVSERSDSRFGVATTGLAGPGGAEGPNGSLPQGMVCIATWDCATAACSSQVFIFDGDREAVRAGATLAAMDMAEAMVRQAPALRS